MSDSPVDSSDAQTEAIPRVGVTDAERELANDAHVEFESKQFDRYDLERNFNCCTYIYVL